MKVQVIIGSTRPARVSDRVAQWAAKEARQLLAADVEVLDLRDYSLPFFDEEISPQYNPNRKSNPAAKRWLNKIAEADAYVLATPEYNRSYPAVLKNAIDYADFQMSKKPVALVAHGVTGGAQAVAHLRGVLAGAQAFTTPNATYISDQVSEMIDEHGNLSEKAHSQQHETHAALSRTLEELGWYAQVLKTAREAT